MKLALWVASLTLVWSQLAAAEIEKPESPTCSFPIQSSSLENAQLYLRTCLFRTRNIDLTAESVNKANFTPLAKDGRVPAFGFSDDYFWFRFHLENQSTARKFVMALDHIYLNQVTLFEETPNGFRSFPQGLDVPFSRQNIPYYGYAWKTELDPGTDRDYLLRVHSRYPVSLPLTIYEQEKFSDNLRMLDKFLWLYIGIVLVLIAYNSAIFLFVRDKTYLYYIFSLISLHLFTNLAQYGLVRIYFFPNWVWFHSHVFYFAHFLSVVSAFFFTRYFLEIPKQFPRLSRLLFYLALNNVPLLAAGMIVDKSLIDSLCQLNTTLFTFGLLLVSYLGVVRGNRQSLFFSIAWTCLLLFWIFNFLRIDGFIPPSVIANYSILVGAVLEGVLLSFALADRLNQLHQQKDRAEREVRDSAAKNLVARQVAHDIRSPLTALEFAMHNLEGVPEDRKLLIRSAAQRIKDIANDLVVSEKPTSNQSPQSGVEPVCMLSLIEAICSEKRIQYANRNIQILERIDEKATGVFVNSSAAELKRVFSNLLDNAIEASPEGSEVNLILQCDVSQVHTQIMDSGKGIPTDLLPRLGKERVSVGKSGNGSGSGLGLLHASATVERWGGRLSIASKQGKGTCVTVRLPSAKMPKWIGNQVELMPGAKVLILDNDESIRELWKSRLSQFMNLSNVITCSHPGEFETQLARQKQACLLLVDYDLGLRDDDGFKVLHRLGHLHKGMLVTSYFDDPELVPKCDQAGVRIFPKSYIRTARIINDRSTASCEKPNHEQGNHAKP